MKFEYYSYKEMSIKVYAFKMVLFDKCYIIQLTELKYPSFDFEVLDYSKDKRIFERAWFSKRFNNRIKTLKNKEREWNKINERLYNV